MDRRSTLQRVTHSALRTEPCGRAMRQEEAGWRHRYGEGTPPARSEWGRCGPVTESLCVILHSTICCCATEVDGRPTLERSEDGGLGEPPGKGGRGSGSGRGQLPRAASAVRDTARGKEAYAPRNTHSRTPFPPPPPLSLGVPPQTPVLAALELAGRFADTGAYTKLRLL